VKVFVIGGCSVLKNDPSFESQRRLLSMSSRHLGKEIALAGHDLLVCSPFPGFADIECVMGACEVLAKAKRPRTVIEFHYPNHHSVVSQMSVVLETLRRNHVNTFPQRLTGDDTKDNPSEHDWLLCQLIAMERANAIVTIGGKPNGSASLLLLMAESRRKTILPLTYLQGAAEQSYQRRQYELQDRLSEKIGILREQHRINEVVSLLETLTSPLSAGAVVNQRKKFFLSYPRSRPEETDFIEMVLRRRNLVVFRDERDFGAGQQLLGEIDEFIHQADVFIAVWCNEYACSPWCFDELTIALRRKAEGKLDIWLFCIDGTRVVPPDARSIVSYPIDGRIELERQLLVLLEDRPSNYP